MTAYIQIKDREGVVVANTTTDSALNGFIDIYDVNLWWPYLMVIFIDERLNMAIN